MVGQMSTFHKNICAIVLMKRGWTAEFKDGFFVHPFHEELVMEKGVAPEKMRTQALIMSVVP